MFEKLQKQLNARKEHNSFRTLKLADGLFDFCSNDYLGLSSINKASFLGRLPSITSVPLPKSPRLMQNPVN